MRNIIRTLVISSIFYNFTAGLLGPLWAAFVQDIGGSAATVTNSTTGWAIYAILIGISIHIFGKLEDRVNRRKMFVFGRVLTTIGIAGYIFVSNSLQLFIIQAILGIAAGIMNPAFGALFSRFLDRGRESSEWAFWEGNINIAVGMAALVSGFIVSQYNFRLLFIIMTITSAISTAIATYILRKGVDDFFNFPRYR